MTKVNASPTKEFFVDMISRDIDLNYAIMELIDNSIDGAKNFYSDDYSKVEIKIELSKNQFKITDNCGGIDPSIAKEYAFRFGRPNKLYADEINYEVGVFGIGMKRALFKIGRYFSVESNHKQGFFLLEVDVDQWILTDEISNWDFDMKESDTKSDQISGTQIIISKLSEGVSKQFERKQDINMLYEMIAYFSSDYIKKGAKIFINDKEVELKEINLFYDEDKGFYPYYKEMERANIKFKIFAGLDSYGKPNDAGWYVFCNGRLILRADKTWLTGWGSKVGRGRGIPKFHNAHAAFRGIAFLSSDNPSDLPWNTTKSSLDTSSKEFDTLFSMLIDAYEEVEDSLKTIDFIDEESTNFVGLSDNINKISITPTNIETISFIEDNYKIPFETNEITKYVNISFKLRNEDFEELKRYFPGYSKKDIGQYLYSYYMKDKKNE